LAMLVFVSATSLDQSFDKWMQKYNKKYSSITEQNHRMNIWKENTVKISQMNARARKAGKDTQFGINKFSDLTSQEFDAQYKGYKPMKSTGVKKVAIDVDFFDLQAIPASFDWRKQSPAVVSPVKDQGQCGSCWAFSATEGVESSWALKNKKLFILAPQQIVDCDTVDQGCEGGDLPTAFQYVQANGLETEQSYPYTAEDGTCAYNSSAVVVKITGFQYATTTGNETQMLVSSLTNGPLSICVDAETWQSYTGGIITSNCPDNLDHCVQIVGWDVDATSKTPYWIIRNSWGTDWGLSGYIYVERNKDLCGVSDEATYVTV